MKKYYLFAALATAGLFASCSSEDAMTDVVNPVVVAPEDDTTPAEIKIGIADVEVRGTGTVGIDPTDETATGYGWAGQSFNVYMLEKGTTNLAHLVEGDNGIFNAAVMNTTLGSSTATIAEGTKYFPQNGAFSFWAYRLDDAVLGAVEGLDEADATQVTQEFTIDGSQDIMVGAADTVTALSNLQGAAPSLSEADAKARIYSAYAARRGVNPDFRFKHLLTRLVFSVKPAAIEVSDAATPVVGHTFEGFKITGVTVKSKNTGKLVVAYTDATEPAERIIWSDTQDWADASTLTALELKERGRGILAGEEQQGVFQEFNPQTVILPRNIPFDMSTWSLGTVNVNIDENTLVYDANTTDATTGIPTGNLATIADMKAAGATQAYLYLKGQDLQRNGAVDANADLVALEGVVPAWDATYASDIANMPATRIGESLLVAPADGNGYEVEITYSCYKTDGLYEGLKINKTIQLAGTFTNDPFEAGKTYNVIITLYKDGTMDGSTVVIDPWTSGGDINIDNEE